MPAADPPTGDGFDGAVISLAALADPTRRSLYRFVAGARGPVSREEAAEGVGVPTHSAKFHLDRLEEEGLLETEFRRLSGRTGPGAGRPSKLYRRSDREVAMSLPQRSYDLLSDLLAEAVAESVREGAPVGEVAARVARTRGYDLGAAREEDADRGDPLGTLAGSLRPHGYEPRVTGDEMTLENCPFDRVAREHTDLVCGLNLEFVDGMASGLGCTGVRVSLDPEPGRCCVAATAD